jgi:thiol-disulfide isomerase/thioredoxin
MPDETDIERAETPERKTRSGLLIGAAVVLLFSVIIAAKIQAPATDVPTPTPPASAVSTTPTPSPGAPSQSRSDSRVAYEAALATGKPVYLLFHSLTCVPCVEISAVVDKVVPGYKDRVVFVNAITDDASAQDLAATFKFQYIPTSFFITADGSVSDSFTGVLSELEMKARLDALIAR